MNRRRHRELHATTVVLALLVGCDDASEPPSAEASTGQPEATSNEPAAVTSSSAPGTTDGPGDGTSESSSEDSSSGDSAFGGDEDCFAQQWSWTAGGSPSQALAIIDRGARTGLLDIDVEADAVRLWSLESDGALAFGPSVVGSGFRGDVAAGPDGEWWVVTAGAEGDLFGRHDSEGALIVEHVISAASQSSGLMTIAVAPDGTAVLGGSHDEGVTTQTRLLAVDGDGMIQWTYDGFDTAAHEIAIDREGAIVALTALTHLEGADVSVVGMSRDAALAWSFLAGSHGGFGDERASPFALAPNGAGGFVTLGSEPTAHALTENYDRAGTSIWRSETAVASAPVSPATQGDITRIATGFVAILGNHAPTMLLLDEEGTLQCEHQLGSEYEAARLVSTSDDTVVLAGREQTDESVAHTWVAQYQIPSP